HNGIAEAAVDVVDEEPGTPVRHPQRPPGFRYRAASVDRFQEPYLARADGLVGPEIDPQRQSGPAHASTAVPAAERLSSALTDEREGRRIQSYCSVCPAKASRPRVASAPSKLDRLDVRSGRYGLPAWSHNRLTIATALWLTQPTGNTTTLARLKSPCSNAVLSSMPPS